MTYTKSVRRTFEVAGMHQDVFRAGGGKDGVAVCNALHEVRHEVDIKLHFWELLLQLLYSG
jgi:hypothetical protein